MEQNVIEKVEKFFNNCDNARNDYEIEKVSATNYKRESQQINEICCSLSKVFEMCKKQLCTKEKKAQKDSFYNYFKFSSVEKFNIGQLVDYFRKYLPEMKDNEERICKVVRISILCESRKEMKTAELVANVSSENLLQVEEELKKAKTDNKNVEEIQKKYDNALIESTESKEVLKAKTDLYNEILSLIVDGCKQRKYTAKENSNNEIIAVLVPCSLWHAETLGKYVKNAATNEMKANKK